MKTCGCDLDKETAHMSLRKRCSEIEQEIKGYTDTIELRRKQGNIKNASYLTPVEMEKIQWLKGKLAGIECSIRIILSSE